MDPRPAQPFSLLHQDPSRLLQQMRHAADLSLSGGVEIAIGAFDHPDQIEPQVQVNAHMQMPWIKALFDKPEIKQSVDESTIISYQHPDHDTAVWPPEDEANKA